MIKTAAGALRFNSQSQRIMSWFDSYFKDRPALDISDFCASSGLFNGGKDIDRNTEFAVQARNHHEGWVSGNTNRINMFIAAEEIILCSAASTFGGIHLFVTSKKLLFNITDGAKKNTWTAIQSNKIGGYSVRLPGALSTTWKVLIYLDSVALKGSPFLTLALERSDRNIELVKALSSMTNG